MIKVQVAQGKINIREKCVCPSYRVVRFVEFSLASYVKNRFIYDVLSVFFLVCGCCVNNFKILRVSISIRYADITTKLIHIVIGERQRDASGISNACV